MKTPRNALAIALLILTLSVPTSAGIIDTPGVAPPPPPDGSFSQTPTQGMFADILLMLARFLHP